MTISIPRSLDAASPLMLMFSVSIHGLFFVALILASFLLPSPIKPIENGIRNVKLVEPNAVALSLEKVQRGPVKTRDVEAESVVEESSAPEEVYEAKKEVAELKVIHSNPADTIRVNRRTRSLQKVEQPKPLPQKNPDAEATKKKTDVQDFLEKRLASIRKEVETRKTDASSSSSAKRSNNSEVSERNGSKSGAVPSDDLVQWLDVVRNRINSHWSVFGDARKLERFTVIGVRIDDDGRLVDTSVDESSGDPIFDRSAVRAVIQASPFPPIPVEVREKIRKAGGLALRFTPGGIQ